MGDLSDVEMNMSVLREFIGPASQFGKQYLGIQVGAFWGELIVALSVVIVLLLALRSIYLQVRRHDLDDMSAPSEEQLAKGIKIHIERAIAGLDTGICRLGG